MGRRESVPVIPPVGGIPIGLKIRARRWYQGMALNDLAKAVGNYDRSHISHIEMGRDNPSEGLLRKIAAVLEIEADALKDASREQIEEWLSNPKTALDDEVAEAPAGPRVLSVRRRTTYGSPLKVRPTQEAAVQSLAKLVGDTAQTLAQSADQLRAVSKLLAELSADEEEDASELKADSI
jgi:transcriptional regulator with XRE-family HTH domain